MCIPRLISLTFELHATILDEFREAGSAGSLQLGVKQQLGMIPPPGWRQIPVPAPLPQDQLIPAQSPAELSSILSSAALQPWLCSEPGAGGRKCLALLSLVQFSSDLSQSVSFCCEQSSGNIQHG